jgi:hypothetical protein
MLFEVLSGNKGYSNNSGLTNVKGVRYMQSPAEHQNLLDPMHYPDLAREYAAVTAMPNGFLKTVRMRALMDAAAARELEYPKYWVNDEVPRGNEPVLSSSSWVGNVRYVPPKGGIGTGTAYITLGDKEYEYPYVSPQGMVRFLTAPSLGRFLNSVKPYVGQGF